jgi:histidinol-phosphate/aromatic aminotransferase/cobyric acid decarboxylase-like protein
MMEQGVLVRDCRSFGPPFESYVRFCVKTPEKDALLLKAFRAVLGREGRA